MRKLPAELKMIIAANIKLCRKQKYPGKGGAKLCAIAVGVTPQQWSAWETALRTPDENQLAQIAAFFGKDVESFKKRDDMPRRVKGSTDAVRYQTKKGIYSGVDPHAGTKASMRIARGQSYLVKDDGKGLPEKDRLALAKMVLEERDRMDELYNRVAQTAPPGPEPCTPLIPPASSPVWHSTTVYTGKNDKGETRILEVRMMLFSDGTQEVRFREQ